MKATVLLGSGGPTKHFADAVQTLSHNGGLRRLEDATIMDAQAAGG
jgi:hypothetical protein